MTQTSRLSLINVFRGIIRTYITGPEHITMKKKPCHHSRLEGVFGSIIPFPSTYDAYKQRAKEKFLYLRCYLQRAKENRTSLNRNQPLTPRPTPKHLTETPNPQTPNRDPKPPNYPTETPNTQTPNSCPTLATRTWAMRFLSTYDACVSCEQFKLQLTDMSPQVTFHSRTIISQSSTVTGSAETVFAGGRS